MYVNIRKEGMAMTFITISDGGVALMSVSTSDGNVFLFISNRDVASMSNV